MHQMSSCCKKCKEQTNEITKKFKLKGNTSKINKFKQELTSIINERGNKSDEIIRIESKTQHLIDEDPTQAIQNRKYILELEKPSKSFLNLEIYNILHCV